MQEKKFDGTDILTDKIKIESTKLLDAMNKPDNKFVALHKPGSVIEKKMVRCILLIKMAVGERLQKFI